MNFDFNNNQSNPKYNSRTSYGRFYLRIGKYRELKKNVAYHHFWWFVHNCISHPLIGILPIKTTFDFHDFTSDKINAKKEMKQMYEHFRQIREKNMAMRNAEKKNAEKIAAAKNNSYTQG